MCSEAPEQNQNLRDHCWAAQILYFFSRYLEEVSAVWMDWTGSYLESLFSSKPTCAAKYVIINVCSTADIFLVMKY